MRKLKSAFVLITIFTVISCQQVDVLDATNYQLTVEKGRLVFTDIEHFGLIASKISSSELLSVKTELATLDYVSLGESILINELNSLTVLGSDYMQLLLNDKNEVQIGDKIYVVDNDLTNVYTLDFSLVETTKNSVEVFNTDTNSFVNARELNTGRAFNTWKITYIPGTNFEVWSRFVRKVTFNLVFYSHQNEFRVPFVTAPKAEYFKFNNSVCLCQHIPSSPPVQYTYNVNKVEYLLGHSSVTYEGNNGVGFSIQLEMKPYLYPSFLIGDS